MVETYLDDGGQLRVIEAKLERCVDVLGDLGVVYVVANDEFARIWGFTLPDASARAAEIHEIDGRVFAFPPCTAVLCFDVLHMMPPDDQARLLGRMGDALEPGGVLLVREADATSPRFWRVRVGNRAKAIVTGAWRQPLCFRGADAWAALFASLGFAVERVAGDGGAFGNVLFRLSRPPAA